MTVQQLLENVTSRELSEWEAFVEIMNEPKEKKETDETLKMKLISAFTRINEQDGSRL